jgi:hypothetical protein
MLKMKNIIRSLTDGLEITELTAGLVEWWAKQKPDHLERAMVDCDNILKRKRGQN